MKRSSEAEVQTKRRKRRFEDLLAKRTSCTDNLSGNSRALLNQAVFQLIDHHQDLNQLLKEATIVHGCDNVQTPQYGPPPDDIASLNPTVLSCVNYLKHSVTQDGTGSGHVSTRSCIEGLKVTLGTSGTSGNVLLTQEQRKRVQPLLSAVQTLQKDQSFSRSHFIKCLTAEVALPLELVWYLHQTAGIPLSSYLACNVGKPKAMSAFVQSVVQAFFCGSKEDRLVRRDVITGILGSLISYAYTEKRGKSEEASAKGLRKASAVLLDRIFLGLITSREEGTQGDEDNRLKLADVLYHHGDVSQDALQQFCIRQLNAAFALNPTPSVWEVISAQSRWSYAGLPVHIRDMYTQMLVLLTPEDVTKQLEYVVDKDQVNWQAVLSVVSVFLISCNNGPTCLKGLIDRLINQSLEGNNRHHLLVAFLLTRQAGQEGPHVFPPYSQWFQHHFGGSSSPHVASVRTFSCLMRLLSDMVPHETPQCLKIHVLHPPHVLARCRAQLSDYVALAKTRLADLGESIEESSIYEDGSTDRQGKIDRSQQAAHDVERAMAQFEKTGKVPANVIEASIFRRPYYIGRFLPAVLVPRTLPDVPDTRMQFIDALKRAEKIPGNMFTAYTEGCRREAAQLLEGVFEGDEQEELFEPLDQLRHSLDKFPAVVVASIKTDSAATATNEVTPLLSIISQRLTLVLEPHPGQSSRSGVLELYISHPCLDRTLLQVVDLLLNAFCKTVAASSATISEKPDIAARSTADWAAQFVSMLSRHTALLPALHVRLWHLITKQGPHLDLHHIHGLAALLFHLGSQRTLFPKVQVPGCSSPYAVALTTTLCCSTGQDMLYCLKFCTAFLEHATHADNSIASSHSPEERRMFIPPPVLYKFLYLVPRLLGSDVGLPGGKPGCGVTMDTQYFFRRSREEVKAEDQQILMAAAQIYHSDFFQQILRTETQKFSLRHWMRFELQVNPMQDFLCQMSRCEYHHWVLHYFLPLSAEEGGCGGSYIQAAEDMIHSLLDNMKRSHTPGDDHVQTRQLCQHCEKTMQSVGCFSELTCLLQELLPLVSLDQTSSQSGSRTKSHDSWMLGRLSDRLGQSGQESGDINRLSLEEQETCNFMRLCMSLPAEYLYGVSPQERLSTEALSTVAGFINTLLRNQVGQSSCLPFDVTSYLTRGALKVVTSQSDSTASGNREQWLEQLLTASPLLEASLLAWWPKLKPLVSHLCCGFWERKLPTPLRRVDALTQWTSSILEDQTCAGVTPGTVDAKNDTWPVAAALFHGLNTKYSSRTVGPSSIARVIKAIQELERPVVEKVASCLLLMTMLHLSIVDFNCQESKPANSPWVKLAQSVMNTYPGTLNIFKDDTENPSTQVRVCPDRLYRLVPVMFFRTLVACPVDILQNPQFLPTAMSMHVKVNGLYQSVGGEEVWGGAKVTYKGQLLTLDLMGQITRILMHCIPQCSVESLRHLDKGILAQCDPDIQLQVKKRLSSI
ncbi:FANCA [Branchiostoma lanceolatum]|uniref:FANCA protein n=1 Tax=Branchiostoma lanceolatum TaxID=7740 RepID=A0A8K0EX26_BRALA|nr:FANCA [Branchiostoma lanceolatum]